MSNRNLRLLVAVSLLGVVVFGAASLLTYPPPNCDEAYYASPAVALQTRGGPGLAIFPANDPLGQGINWVQIGRLYLLGEYVVFALFGVSQAAARAYALTGWLATGGLTYLVGARLYNRRVGLLAAAAFLASPVAFIASHYGRPESWLTAGILLAIYAVWWVVTQRPTIVAAVVAGVASVVPLDIHLHGIVFLFGLGLAFVLEAGLRRKRWDLVGGYAVGGLVAGVGFVAAHAWPAPELAWRQLLQLAPHYTSLGEPAPGGLAWIANLASMATFFKLIFWTAGGPLGLLAAGLAVLGLIAAGQRRAWGDNLLATVFLTSLLTFGLIFSPRWIQYGALWCPLWCLLGLTALDRLAGRLADRYWQGSGAWALFALAGAAIAAVNVAGDAWLVFRSQGGRFTETGQAVARLVPTGATVFGDANWWWALQPGREFIADDYLIWLVPGTVGGHGESAAELAAPMAEAMGRLQPDYILLDSAIGCQIGGGAAWSALQQYTTSHCELTGQVDGAWRSQAGKETSLLAQTTSVYRCGA